MNELPLGLLLIYDFCKDDLFCAVLDFIHPAYPAKLISGFQFLRDTLLFCHLRDHGFQPFLACAFNFCQVLVKFPGQDQTAVQPWTMLFQL